MLQRLRSTRRELAAPRYAGQSLASELDQHIEDFTTDTVVGGLRELSSSSH